MMRVRLVKVYFYGLLKKSGNGNSLCGRIIHCLASLAFLKMLFPLTLYAFFYDFVNNPG